MTRSRVFLISSSPILKLSTGTIHSRTPRLPKPVAKPAATAPGPLTSSPARVAAARASAEVDAPVSNSTRMATPLTKALATIRVGRVPTPSSVGISDPVPGAQ